MLKFTVILVTGYLSFALAMFLMQRSLLYLPSRHSDINEAALVARGVQHWPDAANYQGYLTKSETPAHSEDTATIIVFHGNAGSAIDRLYYRDLLAFTGARILLVEYPGYGHRAGKPSESVLVQEARSVIAGAANSWPNSKLYLLGESLGAGVAASAVGNARTAELVDGLLLITPWDSLAAVAKIHYWYLPVRWLLRDRYESVQHLAAYKGPKLVVVAEQDSIVPASHGQALYDAIPDSKQLFWIDGA